MTTETAEKSTIKYLGGIHALKDVGDPDDAQLEADVYHGYDGSEPFSLAVDDEHEVSAAKAAQLAEDFPGCFEIDGKTAGKRPAAPAPAAADEAGGDLRPELLKHKRDELNAAAKKLGIDAPEALPNKAAVVDAIVAAKASSGDD